MSTFACVHAQPIIKKPVNVLNLQWLIRVKGVAHGARQETPRLLCFTEGTNPDRRSDEPPRFCLICKVKRGMEAKHVPEWLHSLNIRPARMRETCTLHKGETVDGQDETCYNEQFLTSISPLLACLATLLWRHISHEPPSGRRAQEAKFFQLQFSLKCVSCGESRSGHVGLWEGQKWTWRRESGSSPLLSNRLTDLCSGIKPGLRGKTHKQPRTAHSNEWTSAEAGWAAAAAAAARIALQRTNGGNSWCYLSES